MTSRLNKLGDRMLAAMLPRATAAACLPTLRYYECAGARICGGPNQTRYHCVTNCAGTPICSPVGCC
jgi:hypothetical protein